MIQGVNHITLAIGDLERSWHFYTAVLGLKPVARWPQGAYLLAGDVWLALVVDEAVRKRPLSSAVGAIISPASWRSRKRLEIRDRRLSSDTNN